MAIPFSGHFATAVSYLAFGLWLWILIRLHPNASFSRLVVQLLLLIKRRFVIRNWERKCLVVDWRNLILLMKVFNWSWKNLPHCLLSIKDWLVIPDSIVKFCLYLALNATHLFKNYFKIRTISVILTKLAKVCREIFQDRRFAKVNKRVKTLI